MRMHANGRQDAGVLIGKADRHLKVGRTIP